MTITRTYGVIGLTCQHCTSAVRTEIGALDGVTDVSVALEVGGISQVTVFSDAPVPAADLVAALDEAGDYRIAAG